VGTDYSGSSAVYSHYAIPGWASWQDYEYTGRLKMSDADSGIGLVVYSRYPAGEQQAYILRRYAGTPDTESFHLAASGTSLAGDLQTGVTPQPGTWYHFRVQVITGPERMTVRARVWAAGSAEPGVWQAEAYDESGTRLTAGAVGVRTYGPGSKYFDDLLARPLSLQADFVAEPLTGSVPLTVTFTNLSMPTQAITSALWAYGHGVISNTLALTHPHIYTRAGVYTVTLSVSDGVVTDTLTRTNYITATGGTVYTTTTRVITYTYDKLYRLTGADYSSGESFAYGYDPVGNRTVHTRTLTSTTIITYAYDAANRLVNVDGVDYTWDANPLRYAARTAWESAERRCAHLHL
jgi:YD repeat-containing protein